MALALLFGTEEFNRVSWRLFISRGIIGLFLGL
jgi:hypothetical protein